MEFLRVAIEHELKGTEGAALNNALKLIALPETSTCNETAL